MGKLVYGHLDVCEWCIMKDQNTNQNKSIHKYLYDLQKLLKKNILKEILFELYYVPMYKDNPYLLTYLQEIGFSCVMKLKLFH